MSEEILDVLSVLDKNDQPAFGDCTLQMGEVSLVFKGGRAKVRYQDAAQVLRHPKVTIPGYTGPRAPLPPNVAAELPDNLPRQTHGTPEEREARIRAAEEYLRAQGLEVPPRTAAPAEDPSVLKARIAELEAQLKGNSEPYFADDAAPEGVIGDSGQTVPESETPPEGFEELTADGKPRCWAHKGDGSQCSNAAVDDSHACGLAAHQRLVK